ncbi:MAG: hypothetical protein RLZZ450_4150 [Pseudomonadota bacterium]|jgi:DNA-binding NarL/FixJ family response regulator
MSVPKKRVLVVEDEPDTRRHIADAVSRSDHFELADAVAELADARRVLAATRVDVLLTDLQLPDGHGVELIRSTRASYPDIQILVISVFGDERSVISAVQAGASGYLLKDGTLNELAEALLDLVEGGSPLSPSVARYVLRLAQSASLPEKAADSTGARSKPEQVPRLSPREIEVLELLAKGFTPAEIAPLLSITAHTVVTHTRNIHKKLEVSSRAAAVFEAVSFGIIKLGG